MTDDELKNFHAKEREYSKNSHDEKKSAKNNEILTAPTFSPLQTPQLVAKNSKNQYTNVLIFQEKKYPDCTVE